MKMIKKLLGISFMVAAPLMSSFVEGSNKSGWNNLAWGNLSSENRDESVWNNLGNRVPYQDSSSSRQSQSDASELIIGEAEKDEREAWRKYSGALNYGLFYKRDESILKIILGESEFKKFLELDSLFDTNGKLKNEVKKAISGQVSFWKLDAQVNNEKYKRPNGISINLILENERFPLEKLVFSCNKIDFMSMIFTTISNVNGATSEWGKRGLQLFELGNFLRKELDKPLSKR